MNNLPSGESDSERTREVTLVASTYSNPKDIRMVSMSMFSSSEFTLEVLDITGLVVFAPNFETRTARDTSGS
jgi:hypothetical protein